MVDELASTSDCNETIMCLLPQFLSLSRESCPKIMPLALFYRNIDKTYVAQQWLLLWDYHVSTIQCPQALEQHFSGDSVTVYVKYGIRATTTRHK